MKHLLPFFAVLCNCLIALVWSVWNPQTVSGGAVSWKDDGHDKEYKDKDKDKGPGSATSNLREPASKLLGRWLP
jgi:hypothetical protein